MGHLVQGSPSPKVNQSSIIAIAVIIGLSVILGGKVFYCYVKLAKIFTFTVSTAILQL